jgi:hypothetical protein
MRLPIWNIAVGMPSLKQPKKAEIDHPATVREVVRSAFVFFSFKIAAAALLGLEIAIQRLRRGGRR